MPEKLWIRSANKSYQFTWWHFEGEDLEPNPKYSVCQQHGTVSTGFISDCESNAPHTRKQMTTLRGCARPTQITHNLNNIII